MIVPACWQLHATSLAGLGTSGMHFLLQENKSVTVSTDRKPMNIDFGFDTCNCLLHDKVLV
jgi:hypothetical protein